MNNLTYTYLDRSDWPRGPWSNEPDKEQFTDPATGLPCLIVRNRDGALCGYVGVPAGHPWHGVDYMKIDADCHGGLTFSGPCRHHPDGHGICHVPALGEPDDAWWQGFDCSHYLDFTPGSTLLLNDGVYRNWDYVKAECAHLAEQATRAAYGVTGHGGDA